MAAAAPALAIVGTVVSTAGSIAAGNAQKKAAQQNAAFARMQAEEDARRSRRQSDALLGRQRAVVAASGTTMEGSPLLIVQDAAAEAETEIRHILRGGAAQAGAYRQAGSAAAQAGFIDAGATLLGGAARALNIK
ncbi:MAG: hypothetical protein OEN55_18415 [Alphaproteobacteria bacterium]|nr:hypothetical protein [Alphaproteobacteria bacterium]